MVNPARSLTGLHRYRLPRLGAAACLLAAALAAAGCGAGSLPLAPGLLNGTAGDAGCGGAVTVLGAAQLERAYQAPAMFARGITGAGTTVAVIVPYAGPRVAADLAVYSRRYGLPVPRVRQFRYQDAPPAAPSDGDAQGWVQEGTYDLEMAHALAPRAALDYVAVPADGGSWDQAEYDQALAWLVTTRQVDVVSYSEGIPEAWGAQSILAARAGLQAAARAGTTVVAASGDFGPAELEPDGTALYDRPVIAWPASDPLATAAGGTRLRPAGRGYAPSVFAYAGGLAGGAGRSAIFPRPPWQHAAAAVTGPHRGIADISMDASRCSPALAYSSSGPPGRRGWSAVEGTSIAAPLLAGLVADAAQIAGHPLGVLGPALYQMHSPADGITDITAGTDTIPGLPGYPARPGYDLPTGIGTITSAALFTAALARTVTSASPPHTAVTPGRHPAERT